MPTKRNLDKAAKIVGSVYWRGGAHPSAKEILLVQRIAEALDEAQRPSPDRRGRIAAHTTIRGKGKIARIKKTRV